MRFNLLHSFRRELAACQETAYNRLDNILGNARCQYPNLFTLIRCPPLLDPPPLPLLLLLLLPAVPHVLQWTARSLRDSLLKLQPVKPHRCSGLPALFLPPVTAGMLVRLFPLDNIFINRRNSTVWQFPQNTIPGRHAFPVVAPPPNRRHRLLLGVLIGQRHGVLHGDHLVGVRSQPGLGEPVDHLEQ